MYEAIQAEIDTEDTSQEVSDLAIILSLARAGDSAAQAAVGAILAARQNYTNAVGWLRQASRESNLVATALLARIFLDQADSAENEDDRKELLDYSLDNYLAAVALGSTNAMYELAALYLGERFGTEKRRRRRAAARTGRRLRSQRFLALSGPPAQRRRTGAAKHRSSRQLLRASRKPRQSAR